MLSALVPDKHRGNLSPNVSFRAFAEFAFFESCMVTLACIWPYLTLGQARSGPISAGLIRNAISSTDTQRRRAQLSA